MLAEGVDTGPGPADGVLHSEVGALTQSDNSYRLQVRIFHAGAPGELTEQVNGFLADIPAVYVRAVRFQTAAVSATMDEQPRWEYAALIEYEAER